MSKTDFQNGFALGCASGGIVEVPAKEEQEKTATITENGMVEVLPDENMALSKVTVDVNVPCKEEQEKTITITENGTTEILPDENKALSKVTVVTDVEGGGGGGSNISVEYIESTGTQYIDTGYIANQNTRIKCKYQIVGYKGDFDTLFGDFTNIQYSHRYYDANHTQLVKWGGKYTEFGSAISSSFITILDVNNGTFTFNENGIVTTRVIGANTEFTSPYSILLFSNRYYKNVAQCELDACCKARLYYFKIYDGEELVRDFIPAIDDKGIICFFDNVTETYFYNQGSGEFQADVTVKVGIEPLDNTVTFTVDGEPYEIVSVKSGNSVNEPILPQNTLFDVWRDTNNNKIEFPYTPTNDIELSTQITDLVKLEYIESTGTQYIDLGYAPTNTTNVVCEMMITNSNFPSANMGIFGTRNNKKGTDNFYIGIYSAWTYIGYGSKDTRSIYSGNSFVLNEKQTIIFGKDNMIIGNWNVGAISNEVSTESTMYLFAKNVVGEAPLWLSSGLRVYSFKVYEGEELVREYIPAISSEEGHVNEPCLYDTVTKAYFYNLGTGEFIKN